MEKVKGRIYMYHPNFKTMEEMEVEGIVEVSRNEIRWSNSNKIEYVAYPWVLAKCPYDEEELRFAIVFADDENNNFLIEDFNPGMCIHFFPSRFLTRREFDRMASEIDKIEEGLMYVEKTKKEFAEKMGWEVRWRGTPDNGYYVFVEKTEE